MTDEFTVPLERVAMMIDLLLNGNTDEPDVVFVLVMCTPTGTKDRVKATVLSNVEPEMASDILVKAVAAKDIRFNQ